MSISVKKLVHLGSSFAKGFKSQWDKMKEPCPLGELFYKNTAVSKEEMSKLASVGWHATPLHRIDDQINKGAFEDRGKPIFIGKKDVAAHFGGLESDSVILFVGSHNEVDQNDDDPTASHLKIPAEKHPVHILEAYRVCPKWKEYKSQKAPGIFSKILEAVKSGLAITSELYNSQYKTGNIVRRRFL